uniref:Sister chromatid cohesion protein DCC1 n=1 Tax=Meloidogyne incognita TaxID=6306 RepID=A0A914M156_MELIC
MFKCLLRSPVFIFSYLFLFPFFNYFPVLGKFYWISNEYILKFIEKIAEAVDNDGIDEIACFSKDDLLQLISLENIQMETIDWVLNNFCDGNVDGKYSFNESKISRIYIENLLRSLPDKPLDFEDFELKINNLLPKQLYFKVEYLSGLGIVENSHFRGKVVNKLISTDLPLDLQKRLSILFSKKEKWKKEEIQPYLLDYCLDPTKIEEFLMKNCKIVGSSTERFYLNKQLSF